MKWTLVDEFFPIFNSPYDAFTFSSNFFIYWPWIRCWYCEGVWQKKIFNSYALVMASTIVTTICKQLWKKGGNDEYWKFGYFQDDYKHKLN